MSHRPGAWKIAWIVAVAIAFLLCGCGSGDTEDTQDAVTGRVLFISSYSYSWDTVRMQLEGIEAGLETNITLDFEYMDTKRVDDETSEELFYESLKYRLSKVDPYDVIIVGDDAALSFALKYRSELFDGVPLVFEGVNDEELAQRAAEEPQVTGVIEKLSVEKTVQMALDLNDNVVRVIAIIDDSLTGSVEQENFYAAAELFPELNFSEINCSELTTTELRTALRYVSKYSIVIYVSMNQDASGKVYTSKEAQETLLENLTVPIYRMVDAGIGDGFLGGNVVSMEQSGELAAELAVRALQGEDIGQIDVMDSPNIYLADREVMDQYDLSVSDLPEGTTIVNQKESFFVRNREALVPCVILLVAMLVILGWMIKDKFRRDKLMQELEEARAIMESAAQHDFLTGLPNRSKFMDDLEYMISHQQGCHVIMMDIDDFKKINDTYGHSAGDDALRELGARLKKITSPLLSAYRYAGDEFILLLQSTQPNIVMDTAYQCRNLFTKDFKLQGEKHKVCGSMGIACYPTDSNNLEQVIICADNAMYQVKKNGKNDFAFYDGRAKG